MPFSKKSCQLQFNGKTITKDGVEYKWVTNTDKKHTIELGEERILYAFKPSPTDPEIRIFYENSMIGLPQDGGANRPDLIGVFSSIEDCSRRLQPGESIPPSFSDTKQNIMDKVANLSHEERKKLLTALNKKYRSKHTLKLRHSSSKLDKQRKNQKTP